MVGAVTNSSTSSISSVASSSSGSAAVEAQLAAKQAELAEAKTDDEKTKINSEISKLKAQLSALQATEKQGAAQEQKAAAKSGSASPTVSVTAADKASPESKVPGAVMDVLMKMRPNGGEADLDKQEHPDLSKLYDDMDSDDDGKVTKNEFVSANADRMGADNASKLFAAIDSENTGSISEDQLAASMPKPGDHDRPVGPPPGGVPPQGQAGQQPKTSTTTV